MISHDIQPYHQSRRKQEEQYREPPRAIKPEVKEPKYYIPTGRAPTHPATKSILKGVLQKRSRSPHTSTPYNAKARLGWQTAPRCRELPWLCHPDLPAALSLLLGTPADNAAQGTPARVSGSKKVQEVLHRRCRSTVLFPLNPGGWAAGWA